LSRCAEPDSKLYLPRFRDRLTPALVGPLPTFTSAVQYHGGSPPTPHPGPMPLGCPSKGTELFLRGDLGKKPGRRQSNASNSSTDQGGGKRRLFSRPTVRELLLN
jgi:hypothetical protein